MAKFKKGDRVRRTIGEFCEMKAGHIGTVSWSEGNSVKFSEDEFYGTYSIFLGGYKLVEPTYTPITPEVGQKYRVVKELGAYHKKLLNLNTVTIDNVFSDGMWSVEESGNVFENQYLTTEYLELVEEPCVDDMLTSIRTTKWHEYGSVCAGGIIKLQDEPKLTTMQKLTSALKRALSSDKQALYKTGIINGGLELSGEGRVAYVNALFQNEGDHKAALAEMVEAAKEEIKDNE